MADDGFRSILFPGPDASARPESSEEPDFFHDLNLDQVVASITSGRQEYNLAPFFYASLNDLDSVFYRQEIMQDLDGKALLKSVQSFSERIRTMHNYLDLTEKAYHRREKERRFLGSVILTQRGRFS